MSYSKFKQYASGFNQHYWGDYVHNIWLRYFERHGKDLFKEKWSNRQIYVIVKNEWINSIRIEFKSTTDFDFYDNRPSIVDHLIYADLDKWIKQKLTLHVKSKCENSKSYNLSKQTELLLHVYELLKFSYTTNEIAEATGIKPQNVSYYKKQIKEALMQDLVNSPFNGSRLKVKRITQTEYTKHPEKYEDYEYNVDRDSDENEFFKQLSHKTENHGLLVVLAKTIDL